MGVSVCGRGRERQTDREFERDGQTDRTDFDQFTDVCVCNNFEAWRKMILLIAS